MKLVDLYSFFLSGLESAGHTPTVLSELRMLHFSNCIHNTAMNSHYGHHWRFQQYILHYIAINSKKLLAYMHLTIVFRIDLIAAVVLLHIL